MKSLAVATLGCLLLALGALAAAQTPGHEVTVGEENSPSLTLVGVVLRPDGRSFVFIENPESGKQERYRVGDRIHGGRVARIEADRVTITVDGGRVVLRLARGGSIEGAESLPLAALPSIAVLEPDADSEQLTDAGAAPDADEVPEAAPLAAVETDSTTPTPVGPQPAVSFGGAGGGGQTATDGATAGVPSAQAVLTGLLQNGSLVVASVFSADTLRDLNIDVTYTNVTGTHTQRLELYSPDGALYQRRTVSIVPEAGQPIRTRLPVGGTWITEHTLFGTWQLKVYLDTGRTPLVADAFVLNP